MLADAGFRALESPLPPNRLRDYQALKRHGALPILMDEGIVSPVEAEEFAALGMFDGIAMKVARCGGLWHAWGITKNLEETGFYFSPPGSPTRTCRSLPRSISSPPPASSGRRR